MDKDSWLSVPPAFSTLGKSKCDGKLRPRYPRAVTNKQTGQPAVGDARPAACRYQTTTPGAQTLEFSHTTPSVCRRIYLEVFPPWMPLLERFLCFRCSPALPGSCCLSHWGSHGPSPGSPAPCAPVLFPMFSNRLCPLFSTRLRDWGRQVRLLSPTAPNITQTVICTPEVKA